MTTRRNMLAAIAAVPFAIMSLPTLAAPSFDAKDWVSRWAEMGGSVMLVDDRLSFAFRPEDHEVANPLFREFKAQPGSEEAVRVFMREQGLTRLHR